MEIDPHVARRIFHDNCGFSLKIHLNGRPLEGAIGQSRLRGDARLNEFLMKIRNYREKFVARHGDRSPFPPFKWQKSYHDHIIRDMDDLRNHLAYIARQCSHHGYVGSVWVDGMGDES